MRYIFLVVFTTFSMAAPALAQDPLGGLNGDGTIETGLPDGNILPTGTPCINEADGKRYQCFTLDEMKELQKWEAELRFYETGYLQMSEKAGLLEQENYQLKTQIVEVTEQRDIEKAEKERIYLKWKSDNEKLLKCENTPKWGNPIAWGLAGVFLASTVALAAAVAVK